MKKLWKKGLCLTLVAVMTLGMGTGAFAKSSKTTADSSATEEEVVVTKKDKPYLALGKDLTSEQQSKVLDLMGVDATALDEYDVVYVTNDQEHKYLDSYISKDKIGTRSLSSVVVIKGKKGSGVNVTTKNINYCTTGMYENAMVTAGIEDAEAIVAAPFEISGTAALIGVIEAYSEMTGKDVDEDNIDAALDELVTTGEIKDDSSTDGDEIEGVVAYAKDQVAGKKLSGEEIQGVIQDAEKKFDIQLSDEDRQKLQSLLEKITKLDLNTDSIKKQANAIYDKLSSMGYDIDVDALMGEAQGFFAKLIQAIKDFFAGFGK